VSSSYRHPRAHQLLRGAIPALALALTLVACGRDQDSSPSTDYEVPRVPAKNLTEAQEIALRSTVTCANTGACDPSVALIAVTESTQVSQCSAFLIGPDLMATNAHCIPSDLKTAGSDCSERIWAFFPDTAAFNAERVECSQVIRTFGPGVDTSTPDYAFIRLKQATARPVLRVTHDGFDDKSSYAIHKIDPVHGVGRAVGVQRWTQCQTFRDTILAADFNQNVSWLATFINCDVMHGNSGSPIVDAAGNVRGILQAITESSPAALFAKNLDYSFEKITLGTNLSCILNPSEFEGTPLPKGCSSLLTHSDSRAVSAKKLGLDAQAQSEKIIDFWAIPYSKVFAWESSAMDKNSSLLPLGLPRTESDIYLIGVPKCIQDPDTWKGDYKGRFYGYKDKAHNDITLSIYHGRMGVNAHYKLEFRVAADPSAYARSKLTFNPEQIIETGKGRVTLEIDGAGGWSGSDVVFDKVLERCK
jgi:hypothetical protein